MNTHRAVIETSAPPAMQPIAAGPKDFCEEYLAKWIANHPLGEFDTALVLAVEPQPVIDAVKAVAADLMLRGVSIEERGNNGSNYSHRAEGRGIGYREAARSIYKALEV